MEKIDSRTLPVDALNERRRRAVKMRLDGTSLKDTAALCEMSRTTVMAAYNLTRLRTLAQLRPQCAQ
ncbi:MAG: hypothetical protein LW854_22110 [Rubrivivax sp.]|jgi:DNA-directed RNA polymerase specialized sigma24 family protein|nr:hypothetical protein [Rubrivivax sp.]